MACRTILLLGLIVLDRVVSIDPFHVAALKAVGFFKTQFFEFQCHPGTGRFRGSRSVQDDGLVYGIFSGPRFNSHRVLMDCTNDLHFAALPLLLGANIDDNDF